MKEQPLTTVSSAAPWPRAAWPARWAAGAVRLYQIVLSPCQRLLGPGAGCRFHPGCSEYARQVLLTHGLARGGWLAVRRLARCQPFNPGGVDLPPQPGHYTPGRMWRPPATPPAR